MDKVVHFELPATDMNRAADFYSNVFGWAINSFDEHYFLATTTETGPNGSPKEKGAINGGIRMRKSEPDTPTIVIYVSDIDACIKKVQELGGEMLVPKTKIDNVLYYARIKDSEGNIIGLSQDIDSEQ